MKFTSKDLMTAMGLKYGDRITIMMPTGTEIFTVTTSGRCFSNVGLHSEKLGTRDIEFILNAEYTILPHYILTEDEKGIIRSLEERFRYMYRYYSGLLVVSSEKHSSDITHYFGELDMFKEMFKFIGKEEEVSLDDLRKCL